MRLVAAHGSSKPQGRCGCFSRVALKILRRSLPTLPPWTRQSMASQSGTSSGPFTVTVSNLPFGWGGLISISVQRLTCPRQRPFGPNHQGWYPASYPGRSTEGRPCRHGFPVVFRPPAFACWASCTRRGVPLPSRSAYQATSAWTRRDFHVPHIRVTTGLGALFTPRPSGAHTTGPIPPVAARPHFQGPGPITPVLIPSPELSITRRHQGFTRVHPPGLPPRLVIPWMDQGPLGTSPGLRTPTGRTCGARQGGRRASSTRPELHDRHRRTSYP